MSTACLPSRRESIVNRTRRVRESWAKDERNHRRRISTFKCNELLRLMVEPYLDHDCWAAGAMTAGDLERLYG
jgi:hypothetical protein